MSASMFESIVVWARRPPSSQRLGTVEAPAHQSGNSPPLLIPGAFDARRPFGCDVQLGEDASVQGRGAGG